MERKNESPHGTVGRYMSRKHRCRCEDCVAARSAYYLARRKIPGVAERDRLNANRYFERLRVYKDSLKSKPCADCGIQYAPVAMQFDHLPGFKKTRGIGSIQSFRLIAEEAKKCEVVCANCHALRTAARRKTQLT